MASTRSRRLGVGLIPLRRSARRKLTLYTAEECGLCREALAVLLEVQAELDFELEVVDIGGDDGLERRYRVLLPVVEIDGIEAFTYHVDPFELRARLR